MSDSLQPHRLQHARLLCPSLTPKVCSNSCPLNWWCYLTIPSAVAPFFFCLQYFPASGSFPISQLFSAGGQSIGASASASVLEMNIQGWFPLGLIGLISLLPKGLSMQLWHPSTTIQKNQLFLASSITRLSCPEMTTGKNIALTIWTFVSKVMSLYKTLSGFVTEEQASSNLMAAVTISSDLGVQENKIYHCFHFLPFICHEVLMILVFRMLNVEM